MDTTVNWLSILGNLMLLLRGLHRVDMLERIRGIDDLRLQWTTPVVTVGVRWGYMTNLFFE